MTREDDFIGQLEDYLEEYQGMTPLPNAVRDAIRAELPRTKQIGPISGLMRNLNMTMQVPPAARYGLVAASIVAAVLVGAAVFGGPSTGVGTPTPTATPRPLPLGETNLQPGTYRLTSAGLNALITVPAGWRNFGQWGVNGGSSDDMFILFWPYPDDFNEVYTDPCNWSTTIIDPPVGPTVDDLANALAAQAMRGDAVPTAVTIDGYEGKYLEMSVPTDMDLASCDEGEFRSWAGRYHQGPGQIDRVYILDVDGQRRVLTVNYMPGASEAELAELQAIVDSIDILP
jgi:hypothetical protein